MAAFVVFAFHVSLAGYVDATSQPLTAVFGDAPPTLEEGPGTGNGTDVPTDPGAPAVVSEEVRRLLDEAGRAFADADAALRNGDPVGFATKVQEGRAAFDRARQTAAREPTTVTPVTAPG